MPAVRSPQVELADLSRHCFPLIDVELDNGDAREFAVLGANQLLSDRPDLTHRGMAIAIYDDKGKPVSIVPLDHLQ